MGGYLTGLSKGSYLKDKCNLSKNPFSGAPLAINSKDMQLFVGRENEINSIKEILNHIPDGGINRTVIIGGYGVGKTSFLNRIFWEAINHNDFRFITIKIIAKQNMTYLNFIEELLDRICNKILILKNLDKNDIKVFEEINLNLKYSRSFARENYSEVAGEASALIASLASKLGIKTTEIRNLFPYSERSALNDLYTLYKLSLKYVDGYVLGIDEADLLTTPDNMSVLINGREEIFQTKNILFIFIGSTRFKTGLDNVGSPVREIIDQYIILEHFKFPEERNILNNLISRRIKSVAISKHYKNPFKKEAKELLFFISKGITRRIIRYCFFSLNKAIKKECKVTNEIVLSSITEFGRGLLLGLNCQEQEIIKKLANKEIIKDDDIIFIIKKLKFEDKVDINKIKRNLERQGAIFSYFSEDELRYELSPELRLSVLHDTKIAKPIFKIEAAQRLRQAVGTDLKERYEEKGHLINANLLEASGHLEILDIQFDGLNKEEKISHLDKCITCINDLKDQKLKPSLKTLKTLNKHIKIDKANKSNVKTQINKISGKLNGKFRGGYPVITEEGAFGEEPLKNLLFKKGKYEDMLKELMTSRETDLMETFIKLKYFSDMDYRIIENVEKNQKHFQDNQKIIKSFFQKIKDKFKFKN